MVLLNSWAAILSLGELQLTPPTSHNFLFPSLVLNGQSRLGRPARPDTANKCCTSAMRHRCWCSVSPLCPALQPLSYHQRMQGGLSWKMQFPVCLSNLRVLFCLENSSSGAFLLVPNSSHSNSWLSIPANSPCLVFFQYKLC